jgi:hypothetical protein
MESSYTHPTNQCESNTLTIDSALLNSSIIAIDSSLLANTLTSNVHYTDPYIERIERLERALRRHIELEEKYASLASIGQAYEAELARAIFWEALSN